MNFKKVLQIVLDVLLLALLILTIAFGIREQAWTVMCITVIFVLSTIIERHRDELSIFDYQVVKMIFCIIDIAAPIALILVIFLPHFLS